MNLIILVLSKGVNPQRQRGKRVLFENCIFGLIESVNVREIMYTSLISPGTGLCGIHALESLMTKD
jgi:hypothetical protein